MQDFAGASTLYSIERDAYAPAYRLNEARPLRLKLVGPVRVALEVRPLHGAGTFEPIDGWVRVRSSEGLRLLPINNNLPTQGLAIVGEDDLVPGRKERLEFSLGPGMHELQVESNTVSALARVFTLRPERPLPVLPPLNLDTAADVLAGRWPTPSSAGHCSWYGCLTVLGDEVVAPRTQDLNAESTPLPRVAAQEDRSLAAELANIPRPQEEASVNDWPEAGVLASGDLDAALRLHPGVTSQDAVRRMLLLAWRIEQQPDMHIGLFSEAEALAKRYPDAVEVQSMLARMSRNSGWLPLPIARSAGIRLREINGWQPESPALRIRKALLPTLLPGEYVLGSGGRLLYQMQATQPALVRLHLDMADVAGMVPVPMTVLYQMDQQLPRAVVLTPKVSQSVTISVPDGRHNVSAWIEAPVVNQFLRIRIDDPHGQSALVPLEISYQVATISEPVEFDVVGPAWVRIDEFRDGEVHIDYRFVEAGLQHIQLAPTAGNNEALYRVFQRIVATDAAGSLPRQTKRVLAPVAAPLATFDLQPQPAQIVLEDDFQLGGQEDGTRSYQASWHHRLDPDSPGGAAENFLQFSGMHSYYDENRRTYFTSTALSHLRTEGGPTLGIEEQINYQPSWTSLNFELDASLFMQQPGSPSGTEWAALLTEKISQVRHIDPKSYHIPYMSLFTRALSMQSESRYDAGRVDQDVFTRYKQGHQQGWEWGDTYYRQPWLDSLCYLGLAGTTNQDFNLGRLDHATFKAGWQQLLREAQMDVTYRVTKYFVDDDRNNGYGRHWIDLGLGWDHWLPSQNRWEFGLRLTHDLDLGSNTGMLYITWHGSQGRRYRDFRPGKIDFREVRDRNASLTRNNRIEGQRSEDQDEH